MSLTFPNIPFTISKVLNPIQNRSFWKAWNRTRADVFQVFQFSVCTFLLCWSFSLVDLVWICRCVCMYSSLLICMDVWALVHNCTQFPCRPDRFLLFFGPCHWSWLHERSSSFIDKRVSIACFKRLKHCPICLMRSNESLEWERFFFVYVTLFSLETLKYKSTRPFVKSGPCGKIKVFMEKNNQLHAWGFKFAFKCSNWLFSDVCKLLLCIDWCVWTSSRINNKEACCVAWLFLCHVPGK